MDGYNVVQKVGLGPIRKLLSIIVAKYWPIFRYFFTGTLCGKFAMKWLLNIPPRLSCVATLECWSSWRIYEHS